MGAIKKNLEDLTPNTLDKYTWLLTTTSCTFV
jgi:hypothetical protein